MMSTKPLKTQPTVQAQLVVIVVIYNQKITETEVYRFLSPLKPCFQLVLFDNSTDTSIVQYNQNISLQTNAIRLGSGENLGLSKAYAHAVAHVQTAYPLISWILTLDQDTILNETYFSEILSLTETKQSAIYYPSVYTQNGLFSPHLLNRQLGAGLMSHDPKKDYVIPINSGTLWSINLFKMIHFDESLFLDMVDYDLFFQLFSQPQTVEMTLMQATIHQNFSGEIRSTLDNALFRFKIYHHDFITFCKKWNVPAHYTKLILLKRALKLNWTYKTTRFTQILFKN